MADSDSGIRHACQCGKSFRRREHLTRHQATHHKPVHVCSICDRHFSRKDLLRRHAIVHDPSHRRKVVSCEACRANKTKCSGGLRCSLCTRRDIECIYPGSTRQTENFSNSCEAEAASVASVGGEGDDADCDNDSMLSENSNPKEDRYQENVEFLKSLTVVWPRPDTSGACPRLNKGMEGICALLLAEKSSLEVAMEKQEEFRSRVGKYTETYLKKFHLRWPILHAPTLALEIGIMPLPLAASVCLIGTWFQDRTDWTERFYALRANEILLERLIYSMTKPELLSTEKPWPIELFQAALLALIFSLYRTDTNVLSRAMLLRSVFVTVLRELGAFNAERLATHLQRYYSGSYAPYRLTKREHFRRLLVSTYQFDTYFSLAHGKPPMLHCQEVDVCLPCSFALWNAYGLDAYAMRQPQEQFKRSEVKVADLENRAKPCGLSELFVEDVQLGLCGLLQAIWASTPNASELTDSPSLRHQVSPVIKRADKWKHELEKIEKLTELENVTRADAARRLLLAYRGENDSAAASLERITTLVQDAMVLYYYLKMVYYAFEVTGPGTRIDYYSREETWRASEHGREALLCALQVLKMAESKTSLNPLIQYALAFGAAVTRLSLSGQRCECFAKKCPHAADNNLAGVSNTRPIQIDGITVCVCKSKHWSERFEKAIQAHKDLMVE